MDIKLPGADSLCGFEIETLGQAKFDSPMVGSKCKFISDDEKVCFYSHSQGVKELESRGDDPCMIERAGPREKIYFDPASLKCGIVTCGGLCPGLNDVIRTVVLTLFWDYGVKTIYGFRYGYAGMVEGEYAEPYMLTPEKVDEIHLKGGDILSSSRGPQDTDKIVDGLVDKGIKLMFVIGGDGTMKGAQELAGRIKERGLEISVIGIPKTIDNDLMGVERSFGFSTAVEAARPAIVGAHEEAKGAWNGVGLVKLMGRDSGFIAAYATLANSDVNFCLVPEVAVSLGGEGGFLKALDERLERKHHALIVVAEGVGKCLRGDNYLKRDASGNLIYGDVGVLLKKKIIEYFEQEGKCVTVKYIDPSYIIRSCPANSSDSAYCLLIGQNAVHAGMAGKTNMLVGYWNQYYTHIPISFAIRARNKIDPEGDLWQSVITTTGQKF